MVESARTQGNWAQRHADTLKLVRFRLGHDSMPHQIYFSEVIQLIPTQRRPFLAASEQDHSIEESDLRLVERRCARTPTLFGKRN